MPDDPKSNPGARLRVRLQAAVFILAALIQAPVIFSHENYLLSWFNIDDGFYYFVTARNIADGLGVTFDGIAPTNGFHPLWMLVVTPIFALPGQVLPLRVLAALLIAINATSAALVTRLASRRLSLPAASLSGLAFALIPAIHNYTARGGMEAGLSGLMMILLLDRAAAADPKNPRELAVAGLVAALATLARLDNVFLAGFVGLALLARDRPPLRDRATWPRLFARSLAYFTPLILIVFGYMFWSQIGFGTPTPVSGQVKRWWGTLDNSPYGFPPKRLSNYIGQFVTDDPDVGPWSLATAPLYRAAETLAGDDVGDRRLALAGIGGGLAVLAGLLVWRDRARLSGVIADLGLVPLLLGCLAQIGYYKLSGSVAQRPWYWIGEMLWLVLVGGVLLDSLLALLIENGRLPGRNRTPPRAAALKRFGAMTAVFLLFVLLFLPHIPRLTRIFSPEIAQGESFYRTRSAWLEANTEPGARIGMTGSGSSAYFTEGRTFINLDGLINSYEYFLHLQDGTADEYLEQVGLDYVFGNEYILTVSDPYGGIFEGRLKEEAVFVTGERSLLLWEFMQEGR